MELATIGGIILAMVGIIGGLILEGGNIGQLTQPTALLIVLGGTFGATMVHVPLSLFMEAMKAYGKIFMPDVPDPGQMIEDLIRYAAKARKEGIISLEGEVKDIKDPFMQKALMMAIDGADPKELRHSLEMQLGYIDDHGQLVAKVWESAGAYAPTIGIIGAVMGLIQVMGHLDDIEAVGHGIAVAFVATIYGLMFANVFFVPASGKLMTQHKQKMVIKEMVIDGVLLVIEGVNPMIMRDKLSGFFVNKVTKDEAEGAAK